MEAEVIERFERMERNTLEIQENVKVLAQLHVVLAQAQVRQVEAMTELTKSINGYIDASDTRMKQMEANLDALIRAITAEHSNGKTKH